MTICSDGHEEICFEGYKCPVCETIKELIQREEGENNLSELLNEARSDIKYYEQQITELEKRVAELEHE